MLASIIFCDRILNTTSIWGRICTITPLRYLSVYKIKDLIFQSLLPIHLKWSNCLAINTYRTIIYIWIIQIYSRYFSCIIRCYAVKSKTCSNIARSACSEFVASICICYIRASLIVIDNRKQIIRYRVG